MYLNKRVRIRSEEFYGKVLREFSDEVLGQSPSLIRRDRA